MSKTKPVTAETILEKAEKEHPHDMEARVRFIDRYRTVITSWLNAGKLKSTEDVCRYADTNQKLTLWVHNNKTKVTWGEDHKQGWQNMMLCITKKFEAALKETAEIDPPSGWQGSLLEALENIQNSEEYKEALRWKK